MKYLNALLVVFIVFLISGCWGFIEVDYYYTLTETNLTFTKGEPVPNWDEYIEINGYAGVDSYGFSSVFTDVFDQIGEFDVTITFELKNGETIVESFPITVNEGNLYSTEKITALIQYLGLTRYYQYSTNNQIDYSENTVTHSLVINSIYQQYFDTQSTDNAVYTKFEFFRGNDYNSVEMYQVIYEDYVYVTSTTSEDENWTAVDVPLTEYASGDYGFGDVYLNKLTEGIAEASATFAGGNLVFDIPLSRTNYSLYSTPELIGVLELFGIIDSEVDENTITSIEDNYHLIKCRIKTNSAITEVVEIEFDYTDFLNELFDEFTIEYLNGDIISGVITYVDISSAYLYIEVPEVQSTLSVDDLPTQTSDFFVEGEINDVVIDEINTQLFYTVTDSHYVYIYNYTTFETTKLYFDIKPEQLDYNNETVYVSLSDVHQFWSETKEQYGGIGIINPQTRTITAVFDIDYDPYGIVADDDGYIYISCGSFQHCDLHSYDPETGDLIESMFGIYMGTEIVYSSYTDRIYYFLYQSSNDEVEYSNVTEGIIEYPKQGVEVYDDVHISLSEDGEHIISGSGLIVELDEDEEADLFFTTDIGLIFNQGVLSDDDSMLYVASAGYIYGYDFVNGEVVNRIAFSGIAKKMFIDGDSLIVITDHKIETIILNETSGRLDEVVVNTSVGETLDIEAYLESVLSNVASVDFVAGTVDYDLMDQYFVQYDVTYNNNDTQSIVVYVNVSDYMEPVITLDESVDFEITIGSTFEAPNCAVTDNYDETITCELYSNSVDTSVMGDYEVVYQAIDSSGNVSKTTFIFTVKLIEQEYTITEYTLTDTIGDYLFDPISNAFYYIQEDTNRVFKYDYLNDSSTYIYFDKTIEKLHIYDNKLFVTILDGEHSMYWFEEDQTGELGIIDLTTFTLEKRMRLYVDPFDMVKIDDFIYITSGSGQHIGIYVVDINNEENYQFSCSGYFGMIIEGGYGNNQYIFASHTNSTASMERYEFSQKSCDSSVDAPFEEELEFIPSFFVSPYDDYIFTNVGNAYYQEQSFTNEVLEFAFSVNFEITDIYFDTVTTLTYFGTENGQVYISNNTDYIMSEMITINHDVDEIEVYEGVIYIIGVTEEGATISVVIGE